MRSVKKPILLISGAVVLFVALLAAGGTVLKNREKAKVQESMNLVFKEAAPVIAYGEPFDPSALVEEPDGTLIINGTADPYQAGEYTLTYTLIKTTSYGESLRKDFPLVVTVIDDAVPVITLKREVVEIYTGDTYDLNENITLVEDGHGTPLSQTDTPGPGTYTIETDGDITSSGSHTVNVRAENQSGNTASAQFTLVVKDLLSNINPYRIKINRLLNCVTVYGLDETGAYTVPVKAMVCSTGEATPTGIFHTFNRSTWRALFGGVYGQYATDIVGDILFHSVPYFSMNKADLEFEEYNKLGTKASLGCIRLAVIDAQWIYNNCPIGTEVEIFDDESSPGPLGKPEPIHIDETSDLRGWDPTDPDPENPWN